MSPSQPRPVIAWVEGGFKAATYPYSLHVFAAMLVAATGLVLAIKVGSTSVALSVAFVSLAMGRTVACEEPFWAAASQVLPSALVGSVIGFINALGNLGGYFGPTIAGWLQDWTGGFGTTALLLSGMLLLAGVVILASGPGSTSGPRAYFLA